MTAYFCTGCGNPLDGRFPFCPSCGRRTEPSRPGPIDLDLHLDSAWTAPKPRNRPGLLPVVAALVVITAFAIGVFVSLRPAGGSSAASAGGGRPPAASTGTAAAPTSSSFRSPTPWPTPSVSGPSTLSFVPVAQRVEALLDESAQARAAVVAATDGLFSCRLPATVAVANLQGVVNRRSRLLNELATIRFEPLPQGGRLATLLGQAWSASLDADLAYLRWANSRAYDGGCDTRDADYTAGNDASARAVAAKKAFAALWNSEIAAPLHLALRSDAGL